MRIRRVNREFRANRITQTNRLLLPQTPESVYTSHSTARQTIHSGRQSEYSVYGNKHSDDRISITGCSEPVKDGEHYIHTTSCSSYRSNFSEFEEWGVNE